MDFREDELPRSITNIDLQEWAEKKNVKFFMVSYSGLNTSARTCIVPTTNIRNVQRNGCGFPSGMYFDADASLPEVYSVPDENSVLQLPWKRDFAWVSSNIYLNGKPFDQCPRTALQKFSRKAKDKGYIIKTGVEPEFLVFDIDSNSPDYEREQLCLHDPHALMARSSFLTKIHDCMQELDWGVYMIDHEASKGQYEINFGYTDALTTADRFEFMKFMMREIAGLYNLKLTFMPRAMSTLLGGTIDERDVSDRAKWFVGGVLSKSRDITAVLCPIINSYKRISSGAYCPSTITWGGNNRSVLVRIPSNNRVEHRLADASTNLYLAQILLFAAGIEGMENKTDPGNITNEDILLKVTQYKRIAFTLNEALQDFGESKFTRKVCGDAMVDSFIKLKNKEIDLYNNHISKWEYDYYFKC